MRFVFGYAGIPAGESYDRIFRKRKGFLGDNADFIGKALTPYESSINQEYIDYFLNGFKERLLKDIRDQQLDTAFAIIYIRQHPEDFESFERAFFPTTLLHPIEWQLTGRNTDERNCSINNLYSLISNATQQSRKVLRALHKEVCDYQNRTPLLLPIKNFKSNHLVDELRQLQLNLVSNQNTEGLIKQMVKNIKRNHPLQKVKTSPNKKACYIDASKVEFHSPGTALHGVHHPSTNHPDKCLLGGYNRLGAPYNPGFHYDCIKGKGVLTGKFHSCHTIQRKPIKGKPHINIATNDFVRV